MSRATTIQPIFNSSHGLFYYEWFAGVAGVDWSSPTAAVQADVHMLQTLARHAFELSGVTIGVNLSFMTAVHLGPSFIDAIAAQIPRGSIVEFTEHAVAGASPENMAALAATCRRAEESGFVVALDDCTVGHPFGNPTIWKQLRAKIIKVNMTDPAGPPVIPYCADEKMLLVCENIATHSAYATARRCGAFGFQGFLLGSPVELSMTRESGAARA